MRYGASLFEAAQSSRHLDKVSADMQALSQLLDSSPDLIHALGNPTISPKAIEASLTDIATKLKFTKTTVSFLRLLAVKQRTGILGQCLEHFNALWREKHNQIQVNVTSRSELTKKQLSKLQDILAASTGKEILLSVKIDDSIIGGMIVNYGSYKLDFSLKTKLNELRHELERLS